MDADQFIAMHEEMGWEIDEQYIPKDINTLDYEIQQVLIIFNMLPDKIEGMSGTWLGKDLSALGVFLDIYEIEDRRSFLDYLIVVQNEYSKHYSEERKVRESQSKSRSKR